MRKSGADPAARASDDDVGWSVAGQELLAGRSFFATRECNPFTGLRYPLASINIR